MNQMQAAESLRIGQRFIAQVEDCPVVLNPLEAIIHDEVGPLAELKRHDLFTANRFLAKGTRAAAPNPAGPGK